MNMKFLKNNKGIIPYSIFDFGNSSFVLIIHAYLFPLYFKNVLFKGDPKADVLWGGMFAVSVILAAGLAPFIGKIADGKGRWTFFSIIGGLSFVATFLLALTIGSSPFWVISSFIIANVFFYLVTNIYDSLLTIISSEEQRVRFSGFAWGFGYIGGIISFLIVYLLQSKYGITSIWNYLSVALFYAVFGGISIIFLKRYLVGDIRASSISFFETIATLDKPRRRLLLGYWLITDCISAIIFFTAIFASTEYNLSNELIGAWLLLVQLLAFPNTYLMSKLSAWLGITQTLACCIIIWVAIIILLVSKTNLYGFFALSVLTSLVIGTTQSLMRAQYSLYLEKVRTSEMFGWYAVATESSAVVAPLLFGFISFFFNSQRIAMSVLIIPLVIGFFFVRNATEIFAKR